MLKGTLGGWQVTGIVTMESGLPLNIGYSGTTVCSIVSSCGQGVRPNISGSVSYPKTNVMSPGTHQSVNALRGPGRDQWNLAMFKTFAAGERLHFELRAESFNTFNHTQFNGVNTGVLRAGTPTATNPLPPATAVSGAGQVNSAFDPRVFQLGAKVIF